MHAFLSLCFIVAVYGLPFTDDTKNGLNTPIMQRNAFCISFMLNYSANVVSPQSIVCDIT